MRDDSCTVVIPQEALRLLARAAAMSYFEVECYATFENEFLNAAELAWFEAGRQHRDNPRQDRSFLRRWREANRGLYPAPTFVVYTLWEGLECSYVGATADLDRRLYPHQVRFGSLIDRVEVATYSSREEMLSAELQAIHSLNPTYNRSGR